MTGDTIKEVKCLRNALEMNPHHGKAAANLTVCLLNLKQFDEARKFAESMDIEFEVHKSFRSQDQYKHDNPEIFTS